MEILIRPVEESDFPELAAMRKSLENLTNLPLIGTVNLYGWVRARVFNSFHHATSSSPSVWP